MKQLVCLASLALAACSTGGGDDAKKQKAVELCKVADDGLAQIKGDTDTDTMMQLMQGALQFCSQACDLKDDASCKLLETHTTKLCGAAVSVCDTLCETATGASLKKVACDHDSKN